jgi:hypothetical protein
MKKYLLLVVIGTIMCNHTDGQVICMFCYDQNGPVSAPVNNLLYNGGFESGCLNNQYFCPASSNFACYLAYWTCTGGGSHTYARVVDNVFTVIPEGFMAAYFGNFFSNSCSTTQFDTLCLSNVGCEVSGIPSGYPHNFNAGYGGTAGVNLKQTIYGLTADNTYVLEFWAGGEWDSGNFTEAGLFAVDVGFGKIYLRNKVTVPLSGVGTRYLIVFNATSSDHTIAFTNWGHACNECTELVLDDVSVYTLAELSATVPSCFTGANVPDENLPATVYLNPLTNQLVVKTNDHVLSEIILYDIASGKMIQEKFTSSVSLTMEDLPNGIYIYEVRNNNGVIKQGKVAKD